MLLEDNVQVHETDWADQLLHEFVPQTDLLYSKVSMTFNVHLLLHTAKSVYDWGSLWAHNAYAFESSILQRAFAIKYVGESAYSTAC